MALLFGHVATPIFADTGFEHPELYERLDRIEHTLQGIHGARFEIIRVQRSEGDLVDYIKDRSYYPSPQARFCTRMFKIEPIDDFLEGQGSVELMIGLNAGEADQRTGNHGLIENVTYTYPLVDLGLFRADCKRALAEYDLEPDFPPYMQRGGCVGCFFKSKREYAAMAHLAPEQIERVAELEEAIQDERDAHYGIHAGISNMRQFARSVRDQGELFSLDDTYAYGDKQTPCGVFCHR